MVVVSDSVDGVCLSVVCRNVCICVLGSVCLNSVFDVLCSWVRCRLRLCMCLLWICIVVKCVWFVKVSVVSVFGVVVVLLS